MSRTTEKKNTTTILLHIPAKYTTAVLHGLQPKWTRKDMVLSVVLGCRSCISLSRLSVSFGFRQLFYGLSDNKSKCIGVGRRFLCCPSSEKRKEKEKHTKKQHAFVNSSREIRLETGSRFHTNALAETPNLLIRRQILFCSLLQWPMTDVHSK